MKLPLSFLSSKKEESEYYLALILTDEKAGAVILKAEEGTLKKINSSEAFFSESLEELSHDDLIASIDKAISRAEEVLPPDIQTHQTVFGVKDNWVDSETKKIKKEYLEKLKKVCNALDLKPIGFMVTVEAITHLMQDEEGAPLSAIFAEVHKKEVSLSLLRGGKVIESVKSPHLESVPLTVDKLLGHFTVPVLPARIVIFQSKPDERTNHAFLNHQWSKHLPFLHIPQVTVLPQSFDMRSLMYGAATQMGYKVIENTHDNLKPVAPELTNELLGEKEVEIADEELHDEIAPHEPTDFRENAETEEAAAASDFGFVVDQDIADHRPARIDTREEALPVHNIAHNNPLEDDEEQEYEASRQKKTPKMPVFLSSLKLPKNLKMPQFGNIFSGLSGKKPLLFFIVPIIVIVLLVVGTIFFYYHKMQANIVLTMKPDSESQDQTVTFSTAGSSDYSNNLIAAKSISTSIAGQASTPATGSKDVGDKAKGTVTIYNNNGNSVTLNSGSTLTAGNGQVFVLDNTVTVASASGDVFSGTTPGTTQTTVTAQDLGTDGNEPSGTEFTIGSDNTVAAKNDNAFTGGTKKTVTVVSSNDIAKLRAELPKSVQGNAQQKLAAQADSGDTVLPVVSDPTLENEVFDHQVGDQASTVSLTGSVVYSGMEYSNSDLDSLAKSIMKSKYPQDPNINNVKETVANAEQISNAATKAMVSIQAGLLPNVNKQDVISSIQSKSISDAKLYLGNMPQVGSADITFSPPIPFLPYLFPSLPHNIIVTITSQ